MSQGAHLNDAVHAARSGYADLARFHCQQAAKETPDDPQVWLLLAWLAGTPEGMAECLQRCVDSELLGDTAQAGLKFARSLSDAFSSGSQRAELAPQSGISTEDSESVAATEEEDTQTPAVDVEVSTDNTQDSPPESETTGFVLVRPESAEGTIEVVDESAGGDNSDAPTIDLESEQSEGTSADVEPVAPAVVVESTTSGVNTEAPQEAAQWMSDSLVDAPEDADESDPVPTILVVDDSPTVRKMAQMTLEARGFRVVTAFDGVAAIKEIARHEPWLILLDINMPRLDGYQLCSLVRKHQRTQHIPVVMLSGKDGMFDKLRGKMAGCSTYMTKPFVPEKLIEVVNKYIGEAACLT